MNKFFGKSDIGKQRKTNQDRFAVRSFPGAVLLAVCDGMGGANGGSVASETALTAFTDTVSAFFAATRDTVTEGDIASLLAHAVFRANYEVYARAKADEALSGMGTTLVAALLYRGAAYVANVGDSRLYLMTDGKLRRITKDHSLVQHLIDAGRLTPEEAKSFPNRNVITRAIGVERTVEADLYSIDHIDGSTTRAFLLCSDGLSSYVEEENIAQILARAANHTLTLEDTAEKLITAANDAGGSDNVTVVLGTSEA